MTLQWLYFVLYGPDVKMWRLGKGLPGHEWSRRVAPKLPQRFNETFSLVSRHFSQLFAEVTSTTTRRPNGVEVGQKRRGGKDDELATANMAALTKRLEEHRVALSTESKLALTSLETKLDNVQTTISDHGQRLTSLEDDANQVGDRVQQLEAKCTALEDSFTKLELRRSISKPCSRRNNIRIAGVPESVQGTQPTTFFSKLLLKIFGDGVLDSPPELERAHRALTAKLPVGKPRLVNTRVHNYKVKEKIIQAARKRRGELFYQGNPVAIFGLLP